MSLINDMLRDLDARRARPVADNMTALPTGEIAGNGFGRQWVAYITAGTALLIAAFLAISFMQNTPGLFAGKPAPATIDTIAAAETDTPGLFAGKPAPANKSTQSPNHVARMQAEWLESGNLHQIKSTGSPDSATLHPGYSKPAAATIDTQPQAGITLHTPSPEAQLARAYREAAHAAGTGQDNQAIRRLENILTQDSNHHQARLLLASLYIRQQRNMNAESLLATGLAQHPQHAPYARLLAQLLVAQARFTAAIQHLQTALPGAAQNAGYHALLAGLYQRTGEPAAAARHYTTALQLAPGHGEWWMGLGISQEQAGDGIAAQTAYRQALQHPLKSALQQYINQRLRQLPAQAPLHGSTENTQGKV